MLRICSAKYAFLIPVETRKLCRGGNGHGEEREEGTGVGVAGACRCGAVGVLNPFTKDTPHFPFQSSTTFDNTSLIYRENKQYQLTPNLGANP